MENFSGALDYVHRTLCDLRENGVVLSASLASLEPLLAPRERPTLAGAERSAVSAPSEARLPAHPPANRPDADSPLAPPPRVVIPTVPAIPSVPSFHRSAAVGVPGIPASGTKAERLEAMRDPVLACTRCPHLVKSRTQVVFGVGDPEAELMFVGEAPGEDEDRRGEPFVGRAGELLTKIIVAMGFTREQIYIANVLKCRPDMPAGASGNRKPVATEMNTCLPYLEQQIDIIQPRVIVALGATAMEGLMKTVLPMRQLRSQWHDFRGTPLMATYHPSYLLRDQSITEKRKVWEDMLLVLERLGHEISEKQRGYFLKA